MTLNIKHFYINTLLARYEYLHLKLSNFTEEVIKEYGLQEKATQDGYVYMEVRKGKYGLLQAGLLSQKLLEERLKNHGYMQSKLTPGYWKHNWSPISFTLVVEIFGVKYVGKQRAKHLVRALKEHYEISEDRDGKSIS